MSQVLAGECQPFCHNERITGLTREQDFPSGTRYAVAMPSKRTAQSTSPIDSAESRKILAAIKRDLRRVERDIKALSPRPVLAAEPPKIDWDIETSADRSADD